jgi:hypothetical protein
MFLSSRLLSRQLASIPLAERLLFLTLKFCVNQVKSALSWLASKLLIQRLVSFKALISTLGVIGLIGVWDRMEQEE